MREPRQIYHLIIPIKILQTFYMCLKLYQVNPKTSITLQLLPVCNVFDSTADESRDVLIRQTHFTLLFNITVVPIKALDRHYEPSVKTVNAEHVKLKSL